MNEFLQKKTNLSITFWKLIACVQCTESSSKQRLLTGLFSFEEIHSFSIHVNYGKTNDGFCFWWAKFLLQCFHVLLARDLSLSRSDVLKDVTCKILPQWNMAMLNWPLKQNLKILGPKLLSMENSKYIQEFWFIKKHF